MKKVGSVSARPASGEAVRVIPEEQFLRALYFEQRRSERSKRPFLLMLATAGPGAGSGISPALARLTESLAKAVRETDHVGWHRSGVTLGVIFTEIELPDSKDRALRIAKRIEQLARQDLDSGALSLAFHLFPDDWGQGGGSSESQEALYSGFSTAWPPRNGDAVLKRAADLIIGTAVLLLSLPLMAIIATLVKATSPGPVLFRQQRVGQYGRRFTFLKFRSMVAANDPDVHRAYVARLISGEAEASSRVFKITNDSRVTPLGRFLRKTSLDELPQLFNVLAGDMSLVGPRPPIPYEVECYQPWHRRRLLEVKPGITGLWQVSGRSKVGFDDMVRMDLQYARNWSIWLDLKILLQTPRVVLMGDGAY